MHVLLNGRAQPHNLDESASSALEAMGPAEAQWPPKDEPPPAEEREPSLFPELESPAPLGSELDTPRLAELASEVIRAHLDAPRKRAQGEEAYLAVLERFEQSPVAAELDKLLEICAPAAAKDSPRVLLERFFFTERSLGSVLGELLERGTPEIGLILCPSTSDGDGVVWTRHGIAGLVETRGGRIGPRDVLGRAAYRVTREFISPQQWAKRKQEQRPATPEGTRDEAASLRASAQNALRRIDIEGAKGLDYRHVVREGLGWERYLPISV